MIAHTAYRISSTRILLFRILCILDVSCCAPCPRAFSATRARRSTATGAASVRTRSTASSLAPDTRRATHMGTSAPVTRGTPNMSISADCSTVSGCAATAALRCSGTGVTSDGATMMPPDGAGDASAGCRGTVCRPVSGSKATAESNAIQTVSQDRIAREVRRAGRITYVACVCHAAFAAPERRRRQTQLAAASAPAPLLPRAGFRRPRWCGSSWAYSPGISRHAPCGRLRTRVRRPAAAGASRSSRRRASRRRPWRSAGSEDAPSLAKPLESRGYRGRIQDFLLYT